MTTIFRTLTAIACAKCGVTFGLDAEFEERHRENHASFYCPNGHSNYFPGKTAMEKRVEQAEADAKRAKADAEWNRQRRESAEREAKIQTHRARALKGAQTKLKKRIASGVCPCCQRSFDNLHRHMTTKHPKYGAASVPQEKNDNG